LNVIVVNILHEFSYMNLWYKIKPLISIKQMKNTRRNKKQYGGTPTTTLTTPQPGIISEVSTYINDTMGDIMSTRVNPMIQRAIEMQLCKCDQKTLDMLAPEMENVKAQVREVLSKFAGQINRFSVESILNIAKAVPFLGIFIVGIEEIIRGAVTAENARGVYTQLMQYVNQISQKIEDLKAAQRFASMPSMPTVPTLTSANRLASASALAKLPRTPFQRGGGKRRKHEDILERTIDSMREFDETTHSPLQIHIRNNTRKNRKHGKSR
jgi:hypothetical protein